MMTTQTQHDRRDELQREIAKWEGIVQEAAEAKLEAEIAEAEAGDAGADSEKETLTRTKQCTYSAMYVATRKQES